MTITSPPPQSTVVLPFLKSGTSSGTGPSSNTLYAGSVGANNQANSYRSLDTLPTSKTGGKTGRIRRRIHRHSKNCRHRHCKRRTNRKVKRSGSKRK